MLGGVWYSGGLRFTCTRCSACCRGESGFVFVNKREVQEMAALLSLPAAEFTALYCRTVSAGTGVSLKEKQAGDCVLWDSAGCRVYQARPVQCRTYPFWPSIMESRASWTAATADCPGAGRGALRDAAFIQQCCRFVETEQCAE